MSGLTESRLFLFLGWVGTTVGIGLYSLAAAVITGSVLFLAYAVFVVDVTRPKPQPKRENPANGSIRYTTHAGR